VDNAAMQERPDIAARLKTYRLTKMWTLKQLANAVGLSTVTVWKIENGKVSPHELTVAKIQRALPDFEQRSA
jgi:transcriptional regulator with XRE-family HTH domain